MSIHEFHVLFPVSYTGFIVCQQFLDKVRKITFHVSFTYD